LNGELSTFWSPAMPYTYEQLHLMTVGELRDIAKDLSHDAVKGFSTMHKEKLLPALCHALGIEAHVHHEVVGVNKSAIKAEIRKLKTVRETNIKEKNSAALRETRRKIRELKRKLRKAMV
jgi:hypothetical protein